MFTDYMNTTKRVYWFLQRQSGEVPFFRTVLVPTCEVGFYMTKTVQSRTCEGQNTWSGDSPACHLVSCTAPQLKHGTFKADNKTHAYQ